MDQPSLIVDDHSHPGVRILTLNRVAKANALHEQLYGLLNQAFEEANDLKDLRAVVVKSASNKIFCAGADVNAYAELSPAQASVKRRRQLVQTMITMLGCHKPVIAALEGKVIGAGAMLALAADVVLATESVTLSFPEIHLGMPSPIGIAILKKRASLHLIHPLIQLGEVMQARELVNHRLIDGLCESQDLIARCLQDSTLRLDPQAFQVNKQWLNRSIMDEILEAERFLNELP